MMLEVLAESLSQNSEAAAADYYKDTKEGKKTFNNIEAVRLQIISQIEIYIL